MLGGLLVVGLWVGVPSGAGVSLGVQPVRALRLELGGSFNGVAPGGELRATLIGGGERWRPLLSLEAGMFAPGDVSFLLPRGPAQSMGSAVGLRWASAM